MVSTDTLQWIGVRWFQGKFGGPPYISRETLVYGSDFALNQSIEHCESFMHIIYQWPFQEPKLEVPTIYKAYESPCKGISPQNMALPLNI